MKKFLSILALAVTTLTATVATAQHTLSRQQFYGVTDASVTSYNVKTFADLPSATKDSLQFRPNAQVSYYHVNLVDSAIVNLKSTASCFYGDVLQVDVVAPAFNTRVVFSGNWRVSTGTTTISFTASTSSQLLFFFNGVDWIEQSRLLNYTR